MGNKKPKRASASRGWLTNINSWGLVVAGLSLLVALWFSLWPRSNPAVERANVLLEEFRAPTSALTLDTPLTIRLKNFGKTGAETVVTRATYMLPGLADPPMGVNPPIGIGAGAINDISLKSLREQGVRDPIFREIMSGKQRLLVSIIVEYRDVFGGAHDYRCMGKFLPPRTWTKGKGC